MSFGFNLLINNEKIGTILTMRASLDFVSSYFLCRLN